MCYRSSQVCYSQNINIMRCTTMKLHSVNLNLLLAFDVLITEKHVSRAADKLHLSQSATSHLLKKLRELFRDDILVRTAQGMQPTKLALQLAAPIRHLLDETEALLNGITSFEPEKYDGVFSIGLPDILQFVMLPTLLTLFQRKAPLAKLNIYRVDDSGQDERLDVCQLDLTIGVYVTKPRHIANHLIYKEESVIVGRKSNPLLQDKITLEEYMQASHIIYFRNDIMQAHTSEHHIIDADKRHIALTTTDMTSSLYALSQSDVIALMPKEIIHCVADALNLATQPLPFEYPVYNINMFWNKQLEHSAKNIWLRDTINKIMIKTLNLPA